MSLIRAAECYDDQRLRLVEKMALVVFSTSGSLLTQSIVFNDLRSSRVKSIQSQAAFCPYPDAFITFEIFHPNQQTVGQACHGV